MLKLKKREAGILVPPSPLPTHSCQVFKISHMFTSFICMFDPWGERVPKIKEESQMV